MSSQHRAVGDPRHLTEEDVFTRFAKSITVKWEVEHSYGIPQSYKQENPSPWCIFLLLRHLKPV